MDKWVHLTRREMLKLLVVGPAGAITLLKRAGGHASWARYQIGLDSDDKAILWEGRTTVDNSVGRDLNGNLSVHFPTVQGAAPYTRIVWSGYKLGSADLSFRILARSVDALGMPLRAGWYLVQEGTITTPPQRWFSIIFRESHWDEYRIELRSATSQVVYSRLQGSRPLLSDGRSKRLLNASTLLVSAVTVDSDSFRDITYRTQPEQPTLDTCGLYAILIWTGVKLRDSDVYYAIEARMTDWSGAPLGSGWLLVRSGMLRGTAGSWFRVEIGDSLFFDQYRIRAWCSEAHPLFNKIMGVG
jgi:hypothetical protein